MKKILSLLLVFALILTSAFVFAACGDNAENGSGGESGGDSAPVETETVTASNGKSFKYPKGFQIVQQTDSLIMLMNYQTGESITITFSSDVIDPDIGFNIEDYFYADEEEFTYVMEGSSLGITVGDVAFSETENSQTVLYRAVDLLDEKDWRAWRIEVTVEDGIAYITTFTVHEKNSDHSTAHLLFS